MKIKNTDLEIIHDAIGNVKADVTVDQLKSKNESEIRRATAQALTDAAGTKAATIVFPPLGLGNDGFPATASAKIMTQEVMKFARFTPSSIKKVIFCLPDEETFQTFKLTVSGYVTHIQDTLGDGPYVTVDAIIELPEGIVLIERSNPPFGWALPGGFVDNGESLETAVAREVKEETHLDFVDFKQFHTYSDPSRDPRFHTVATVFVGKGKGKPQFGDDAKGLQIIAYDELLKREYAFDHKGIIKDYLKSRGEQ